MSGIIEQKWISFSDACGDKWTERQRDSMRVAFYAGATAFFSALNQMAAESDDPGDEPTEGDLDRVTAMAEELAAFALDRLHIPHDAPLAQFIRYTLANMP